MRFIIRGTVQGVGFRPTVYRVAKSLGLKGKVYNDGASVIIETDGNIDFIDSIKKELTVLAHIESVETEEYELPENITDFTIVESTHNGHGVGIPTDTAICNNCIEDIKTGRRKDYAFTSCTSCGPRFTLMDSMPYDRERTSMNQFDRCPECGKEYSDSKDRRFHHQTNCCPKCGPSYRLVDNSEFEIKGDPIETFAKLLDDGKFGIAKSWGGMHICCSLDRIDEMREWYHRKNKPFAIMVKDEKTLLKYTEPTDEELKEITSPLRPIVLIKKKETLPESVSPGLDTVGVFLPYSAMHHILFEKLKNDALIMTSANVPGEPMILKDEEIMELGADMYLLHNQRISNRADDSVIKLFNKNRYFIRKSRGHIPSYLNVKFKGDAIALGPQENLTASIATNGRIYSTQHIGNGESIDVVDYLQTATNSFIGMLGCTPSAIAIDIHPGYSNRKYGKLLSEKYSCDIIEVQHHWAHCASLMVDSKIDEMAALSVDGTGHGTDGQAWGGEIMNCTFSDYKRVAHLQYIPLIGGEKALYDIRRLKFAINEINNENSNFVTEMESNVFRKMMQNSTQTSSLGRILDALAYSLDICKERTYDGEPAMRMEPVLAKGKLIEGFETEIKNGIVQTANLFSRIKCDMNVCDVAYSIVDSIITKMVESACDSLQNGVKHVGITGGVSYSIPINKIFKNKVESLGYIPVFHNDVPNGDGGVSVGQVAIALEKSK